MARNTSAIAVNPAASASRCGAIAAVSSTTKRRSTLRLIVIWNVLRHEDCVPQLAAVAQRRREIAAATGREQTDGEQRDPHGCTAHAGSFASAQPRHSIVKFDAPSKHRSAG